MGSCSRWWTQLYMLIWKNLRIRWRAGSMRFPSRVLRRVHIPVFLIEVFWPIVLYLIIVILRVNFPPNLRNDSEYRPIALPSAGTLPFIQSVLCDLEQSKHEKQTDMPTYPNATINKFYSVLDEFGSLNGTLDSFCSTVHSLADQTQTQCINSTGKLSSPECQTDTVPVTCFLSDPDGFEQFLTSDLHFGPGLVSGIMGSTVRTSLSPVRSKRDSPSLPVSILQGLLGGNTTVTPEQLKIIVCVDNGTLLNTFVDFENISTAEVSNAVCSLNNTQFRLLANQLQTQVLNAQTCDPLENSGKISNLITLTNAQKIFQKFSNFSTSGLFSDIEFSKDNDSNDTDTLGLKASRMFFCGDASGKKGYFQTLLERTLFGNDYQQGGHVANGGNFSTPPKKVAMKVLFSPLTNLTEKVITKASRIFNTFEYFKDWAWQIANCSDFFLENFPPNSTQVNSARQLIDFLLVNGNVSSSPSTLPAITSLVQNITFDTSTLEAAQRSLSVSAPGNLWEVVTNIRDTSLGVYNMLNRFDWDVFYPLNSEADLVSVAANYTRQTELGFSTVFAGVVFEGLPSEGESFTNTTIKIRMNFSSVIDPTDIRQTVWTPGPENNGWKKAYLLGTFVFIQDMVERALAEEITGKRIATPGLYLQQMPYPCYVKDSFVVAMEFVLPLAMLFAWLFPVAMTVRSIVREKEVRLKEYIKMIGVSDLQLKLSRLIVSGGILLVSVGFITLLLKVGNILPLTDWFILLLYLTLYAIVMLGYSYLVSVFFNNANLAACVASLLYFMVLFGHTILVTKQEDLSPFTTGLCCLWAPLGFALGAQYMVQWEVQQVGLNWSNITGIAGEEDRLSFLAVCIILVVDIFLYFLATWYIEGVAPGRYGVSKPFYFPLMPSYWLGRKECGPPRTAATSHMTLTEDDQELVGLANGKDESAESAAVFEDEPQHLTRGISIDKLTKTYSNWLPWKRNKVIAVKDLSLSFYEGQITALLGHNGAGKTTTLSVLAGLYEPTSGTASIYGNSIQRHMDLIRQGLGICPQHNILFDDLTVREHLMFFGRLKGLSWSASKAQIPEWLSKVDLLPHANKLAKFLSGGMKRKLSILLAFVGGSRTIILDEPTAGVDPFARRQIWDFLLRQRKDRTIILSTHHMDEAEILGDRIAIISNGSLICSGSFEFLKHRFGRGHQLALVTSVQTDRRSSTASKTFTVHADVEETDQAPSVPTDITPAQTWEENMESITRFIQEFVASCQLQEVRGRELHYLLPLHQARPTVLARLFRQLDNEKHKLGIVSYGLTACSMEEIFIQLTEKDMEGKEDTKDASVPRPSIHSISSAITSEATPITSEDADSVFDEQGLLFGDASCEDPLGSSKTATDKRLSYFHLWLSQYLALIVKRFHYTKRKLVALLVQNVLPLLLILISLLIAHFLQDVPDPPQLELSPNLFFKVSDYNYIFVGGHQQPETDKYIRTFFQPCGAGASVTADNFSACFPVGQSYESGQSYPCLPYPQDQYKCTCEMDYCDAIDPVQFPYPDSPPQCFNGTGTGSRIQNITVAYDPSQPELGHETLTTYLLRSKNSFLQQRYGGMSFGHVRTEVDPSVDEYNYAEDSAHLSPFLATRTAAKVWYSLKGRHAMPSYINLINNGILRANLDQGETQSRYGIRTISHPYKTTDLSKLNYAIKEKNSFLVNPLAAMFSLGFVVAGFILILVEERSGNVKHLQLVCGMNKAVYWLATATWDMAWYLGFVVLMLCLYLAFQDPFYTTPETFPLIVLILLCYGFAVTPWVYCFSFIFNTPATAYVVLFCLNFFGGFCILIVDAILLYLASEGDGDNNDFLNYKLGAFPIPAYPLARSLMFLSSDYPLYQVAATLQFTTVPNPYEKLTPFLIALVGQGLFYIAIIFVVELWPYIRGMLGGMCSTTKLPPPLDTDKDVRKERSKVSEGPKQDHILMLDNLSKVYSNLSRNHGNVAVNQVCLSMRKAECFGLLGVNGAGKTSTFRMLTGDTPPTAGDAVIAGNRLSKSRGPVKQSIGYCPQVDALIDPLTGRQHLTLYCKLRGLPSSEVSRVVDWALLKLGLQEYADRPAGNYSGGNRRKLSTAISLLARPPLILLDEPTSGVDPRARHFLWTIIKGLVNAGQSVVLTTHSMAECEALCSRVAIMVNGEFHCLGSPQQLKSTYGEGYKLKVKVGGDVEAVKEFIQQKFPESVLKEEHCTTLIYQLPTSERTKLHDVFESIEQARETLDVQDYSVSQTTLDDVFIHFANQQNEGMDLEIASGPISAESGVLVHTVSVNGTSSVRYQPLAHDEEDGSSDL